MTPRQLSEPCRPLPTPHGRLLLHLALVFVTSPSQPSSPLSTFDVDGMKRTCALLPSSLVATQFSVVLSSGGGVEGNLHGYPYERDIYMAYTLRPASFAQEASGLAEYPHDPPPLAVLVP
uniref:Uncharacterized protein n=1 Tax=Oryza sativa subsp. japonica TaxID=39947 RepID=Q6AVL4_ORYSJ|nr:hypothetical protein [Oryza sativa Japonica Group]